MTLPKRVTICEVGTRDGFQIEPDFIPTELKVEVVNRSSHLSFRAQLGYAYTLSGRTEEGIRLLEDADTVSVR